MSKKSLVLQSMAESIERNSQSKTISTHILHDVRRLAVLVGSFENTIDSKRACDTPERHVSRIMENANSLKSVAESIEASMHIAVANRRESLHNEALAIAKLTPEPGAAAAEIREVVRSMNVHERSELLRTRDPEIISALVGSNPLLHGVPQDGLDATIKEMIAKAAPEATKEMRELDEFTSTISTITEQAREATKDVTESQHVKDVLKAAQEAESVHSEFLEQLK